MAKLNIIIARSKFNFENKLTQFLDDGHIRMKCFETYGDFKAPKKFKIIINKNDIIKEHYIELNLNKMSNSYEQHYLGLSIDYLNTKISVIALTELEQEKLESISFGIIFENNYNDKTIQFNQLLAPKNE